MKKIATFLFLFSLAFATFAQEIPYNANQRKAFKKISTEFEKDFKNNQQKATDAAKKHGWTIDENRAGRRLWLHSLSATGEPLYLATESNTQAGKATRTDAMYGTGSLGLGLNGSTLKNKLGVWDGGAVLATHIEFGGRVSQIDNALTTLDHSTHVSGTLIAAGINANARGMSFGANLKAWDYTSDVSEMATASGDLLISCHSYGFQAAWQYNPSRTGSNYWEWWGDDKVSKLEDYKMGYYDASAQSYDKIAYNAPYYLILKSAGNSGNLTGPAKGEFYYLRSGKDTSTLARGEFSRYDLISMTGNAKNILSIGAVNPLLNPPAKPSDISISSFSSWGPTDDGRIKPDICGVGVNILSTTNTADNAYAIFSGTSMATPQVAGSLFLLQEYYAKLNSGQFMLSSTLKGLALHTAEDAGNAGPDYVYGWGLLNVEKAAKIIANVDKSNILVERQLAQGQIFTQDVVASGKALVATICWTDPEATPLDATTSGVLNNRTPRLVNDLDIRISDGTTTFQPYILDPSSPSAVAKTGDNVVDNVEQIYLPNAVVGKTYTISIKHKGTLQKSPQAYSLIVSGVGGKAYCASNASNNADSRIDKVVFGSINNASATGCAAFTDFTNLATSVSVGQQIPLEITLGTCGANADKIAKVFVDWNVDGDFEDANELMATSPIINGTDTYKTTLTIPTGLTIGNNLRMRVVCTETNTANSVISCGAYAKGETEDYSLNVNRPANDISVFSLTTPETSSFCVGAGKSVSVTLRNTGTNAINNIPVTTVISDGTQTIATLTGTLSKALNSLSDGLLNLDGTFDAKVGVEYTFTITANAANDQDPTNNVLVIKRKVLDIPAAPTATAMLCSDGTGGGLVTINSNTKNTFWYDAATAGNLLFQGSTGKITKPNKVFVSVNDFSVNLGPKDKNVFGGGSYSGNFGPKPTITTYAPLLIESARMYIGMNGRLTFTVNKMDGTTIASTSIDVTSSRDASLGALANGQLADDPNDKGAVYPLNLSIPSAGDYYIDIAYENGVQIFRSNKNADASTGDLKGYPFGTTNLLTINSALFDSGNGAGAQPIKTGFYYWYDWKVSSLGCPSARVEVPITNGTLPTVAVSPMATQTVCNGDVVKLSASSSVSSVTYQWQRNGQAIAGATNANFDASTGGAYSVLVTGTNLCPTTSSATTVAISSPLAPQISRDGFVLTATTANNYQWLLNGQAIAGATSQKYTVTQGGNYQVQNNQGSCLVISDIFKFVITATEEPVLSFGISLSPNPAKDYLKVQYQPEQAVSAVTMTLLNVAGVPMSSQAMTRQSNNAYATELDLSNLSSGTFFVKINDGKNSLVKGFVRE